MEKIKKYIDCYIPTETCNLRCNYCYITQQRKFNNKLAKFNHTTDELVQALSEKRLGGKCLINLCAGGETLLIEELIPIVEALLKEGHYVMIVTNGTLEKRFSKISHMNKDLLKRLFFKFSFHYLELKRLDKLDTFFNNINLMKNAGASFTVEITPNDELIPYIEDIKKICLEKLGALSHITIARDDRDKRITVLSEYSLDEYYKIWSVFDSKLLEFKKQIFYKKRKEFCYAGDWSYYLNLGTGDLFQCYGGLKVDNIFETIDKPLKKLAVGNNCRHPHCYNGHSFLSLGVIPELKSPYYSEQRNRKCKDESSWLVKEMEEFMGTKLGENNIEYTPMEKKSVNKENRARKIKNLQKRIYNKLRIKKDNNNE